MKPLLIGSALLFAFGTPVMAGPCTQRIADLEKNLTAQQEGGGSALAQPKTTGSTSSSGSTATNPTAQNQGDSRALDMLQQAKQLDQQGKEAECMDAVSKLQGTAPATK
jgi:hypothetical protein